MKTSSRKVHIRYAHRLVAFTPSINQIRQLLERLEKAVAAGGASKFFYFTLEPAYNLVGGEYVRPSKRIPRNNQAVF